MRHLAAWLGFLLFVGIAIPILANATMSKRTPVDEGSTMEVIMTARISHEPQNSIGEMARTLFATCRLQVPAVVHEEGFRRLATDRFRFVIQPSLNESDRRQLHGCLEDSRLQHLQADVIAIREISR